MISILRLRGLRRTSLILALVAGLGCSVLTTTPRAVAASKPSFKGAIMLKNVATKKCVDVPGKEEAQTDGPVIQWTCHGTPAADNMRWTLQRQKKNHKGGYARYIIKHELDSTCLDLPNYGRVSKGTPVTTYPCAADPDKDNQVFYAKKTKRGWMFIHDKSKNLCLDVAGASSKKNGEPITLWTCNPKGDHDWTLKKVTQTKNMSVDGAYSQTQYTIVDENTWQFRTYVSDRKRDKKNCAYVRFTMQYKTETGVLTGWLSDGHETVWACSTAVSTVVRMDPDEKLHEIYQVVAIAVRVLVSTCESQKGFDDCANYHTKPREY